MIEIFARQAYYLELADPHYTGELMKGRLDPGGFLVTGSWKGRYTVIGTCNILLRAEANIGLNNWAAAESDINLVRSKAGLTAVTLTAAEALNQLLHEKRYSLFLKGHRWIDLRRYNKLNDTNLVPLDRTRDIIIRQVPLPRTEGG